jgi:hypothetical protein
MIEEKDPSPSGSLIGRCYGPYAVAQVTLYILPLTIIIPAIGLGSSKPQMRDRLRPRCAFFNVVVLALTITDIAGLL